MIDDDSPQRAACPRESVGSDVKNAEIMIDDIFTLVDDFGTRCLCAAPVVVW